MNKLIFFLFISIFSSFSTITSAEQFKESGDLQVHYIALPTTFLTPAIASAYNIKRSKYTGFINITLLNKNNSLKAEKGKLAGTGKNLIGQTEKLEFKEITEGESVYYIAVYPFTNEEIVNFNIKIESENSHHNLKFQHKFYVD